MIADEETLLSNLLLSEEKTIKEINNSIGPIIYPIKSFRTVYQVIIIHLQEIYKISIHCQ